VAAIPTIDLIAALETRAPNDPGRLDIARNVFHAALEQADHDAALTLTRVLDVDPVLDAALMPDFDAALHNEPDAVYRFVRARLAVGIDERWRFRLRQAALAALHVAITDADTETILSWLTLIAREPISYDLSEVLHYGLLAAQMRAGEDERLARGIILIALKRDTTALKQLVADPSIQSALPVELGALLCGGDCDALGVLSDFGSDVFLGALARAADEKRGGVFAIAPLEQLWHFYLGGAGGTLPPHIQPAHIIKAWEQDARWLTAPSFDHLLTLAMRDEQSSLALGLIRQLIPMPDALPRLAESLHKSGIRPNAIVNLIGKLNADAFVTSTDASRLLELLIEKFAWDPSTQPLVHQWGRFNKNADISAPDNERLWMILQFATTAEHPDELAAHAAARSLTRQLERLQEDDLLIEAMARLWAEIDEMPEARAEVLEWWRKMMLEQSISRLLLLDEALRQQETLEEVHSVIETILATRRLVGKRTLAQFAVDVHTTLTMLQALMDAFDGESKRSLQFEPLTMRAELDRLDTTLTEQAHHIFSSDLKELAHLIGILGDHRSKPNLIRREEEVDRQLMQGEQEPHGGVDVLKWMSGYLDGLQDKTPDNGE
jgi:hypothetical protein